MLVEVNTLTPQDKATLTFDAQLYWPSESLWTDPGIKSAISVRELISTLKKNPKNAGEE